MKYYTCFVFRIQLNIHSKDGIHKVDTTSRKAHHVDSSEGRVGGENEERRRESSVLEVQLCEHTPKQQYGCSDVEDTAQGVQQHFLQDNIIFIQYLLL